jgi:hypothetical protein
MSRPPLNSIVICCLVNLFLQKEWKMIQVSKKRVAGLSLLAVLFLMTIGRVNECSAQIPIYRYYNDILISHFFTTDSFEKAFLESKEINTAWRNEGTAWYAHATQETDTLPVYRFYCFPLGIHLYTMNANEKNFLMANSNWRYEGIAFYAYAKQNSNTVPVYRLYNIYLRRQLLTTDADEANALASNPSWRNEGIAFYVLTELDLSEASNTFIATEVTDTETDIGIIVTDKNQQEVLAIRGEKNVDGELISIDKVTLVSNENNEWMTFNFDGDIKVPTTIDFSDGKHIRYDKFNDKYAEFVTFDENGNQTGSYKQKFNSNFSNSINLFNSININDKGIDSVVSMTSSMVSLLGCGVAATAAFASGGLAVPVAALACGSIILNGVANIAEALGHDSPFLCEVSRFTSTASTVASCMSALFSPGCAVGIASLAYQSSKQEGCNNDDDDISWAEAVHHDCPLLQDAGGDLAEVHIVDMSQSSGQFNFSWDTMTIKDQIIIEYEGQVLFDTGCVGEDNSKELEINGNSTEITIKVIPNCAGESGTSWDFEVSCLTDNEQCCYDLQALCQEWGAKIYGFSCQCTASVRWPDDGETVEDVATPYQGECEAIGGSFDYEGGMVFCNMTELKHPSNCE